MLAPSSHSAPQQGVLGWSPNIFPGAAWVFPQRSRRASDHGNEVWGLCVARTLAARTHHEVVELRGPGHELGPTHGHTDFHEAGVLAGLSLPHLTHDPAGGEDRPPGSQDSHKTPSRDPWPPSLQ